MPNEPEQTEHFIGTGVTRKRIVETNSGIYTDQGVEYTENLTDFSPVERDKAEAERHKDFFDLCSRLHGASLDEELAAIELRTLSVLTEHGLTLLVWTPQWSLENDKQARTYADKLRSAPQIARDASTLLGAVRWLREDLTAGKSITDPRAIALEAYRIGRLAEKVNVRPFEPFVLSGKRARKGPKAAGSKRAAKYRAMYPLWQQAIDESYRNHVKQPGAATGKLPEWSYEQACIRVAKSFKVHNRTVKRNTKNPKDC